MFLVAILLMQSSFTHASAPWYDRGNNISFTFSDIVAQRDAAAGTTLGYVNPESDGHVWTYLSISLYAVMTYNGAIATSLEGVYETNVPGVGIKFEVGTNHGFMIASPSPGTTDGYTGYVAGGYWIYRPKISLIKTGPITPGELTPGLVAEIQARQSDGEVGTQKFNLTAAANIIQTACTVTTSKLTFPMGNIMANEFKGKGTTSENEVTANLGLDCDPDANVNITLTGTQNPDSTETSILALSGQGIVDSGVADGIGVQLLYDNTLLKLNNKLTLKKSAGGAESFPISARYIQTKELVKPGKADATAVLNLTYQ
ncbi:fimbrial protein [Citrobacter sedlakii]